MRRVALIAVFLGACLRPSEHHVALDREVGRAEVEGSRLRVDGGLGAVRELRADGARVRAAAPVITLEVEPAATPFRLTLDNVLPDAELTVDGVVLPRGPTDPEAPTRGEWVLDGPTSARLGPPDVDDESAYRIAVLSDIQGGVGTIGDVFERMNDDPTIRFVVSTGDLTDVGSWEELERFQRELEALRVPFYSTVGNHEVPGPEHWHALFGPFSSFFRYRGVAYSLVDSSNATIDPTLRETLDGWVAAHVGQTHLFVTHIPLLDPAGLRSGAFRSRNEAASVLEELAAGDVDALFFGHVHSYYAYELAGVPTYISGGGLAPGERFDGIDRHYLTVDLSAAGIESVGLVRVD